MLNSGSLPAARLKATITRASHLGSLAAAATPKAPVQEGIDERPSAAVAAPRVDRRGARLPLKPYRGRMKFLGSFKYGGHVGRTGLYLLHAGEHVQSPLNRRRP